MGTEKKDHVLCILFAFLFAGGFLLCLFWPKKTYSASERRMLSPMPELSAESVWSGRFMSDFEDHAVDVFPFRDGLRRVKALTAAYVFGKQDNNNIYAADGFLSAMEYPMEEASLDRAAERFGYICGKYLTGENQVYLSVIPDKNCFLAKESGHLAMDYEDFERQMADKADFAQFISISGLLEREDYYKTDTHWRQERIMDVAEHLAHEMGTSLTGEYEPHILKKDFYGVYYGQAALPFASDELICLTGGDINDCQVYDWQNGREIPVYDTSILNPSTTDGGKAGRRDPYEVFLSGSLSLITIKNPNAQTDRKLVMFRDSFGSSIAPLLTSGYAQIDLVDIRYIHPDLLWQFVDFEGCDVLFLYSTLVLNNSDTIK